MIKYSFDSSSVWIFRINAGEFQKEFPDSAKPAQASQISETGYKHEHNIKKTKKGNSHLMKSTDGAYRGYDKPQSAYSKQPVIKAQKGEDGSR